MSPPTPIDPSGKPSPGSGCLVAAVAAIVVVAILFVVVALAVFIIFPSVTRPPPAPPPPAKAIQRIVPELAWQALSASGKPLTAHDLAGKRRSTGAAWSVRPEVP